jgi:hypothetical protein
MIFHLPIKGIKIMITTTIEKYGMTFEARNKGDTTHVRVSKVIKGWGHLRILGFPVIPWFIEKNVVIYFDGNESNWWFSSTPTPEDGTIRFKLNSTTHAPTIFQLDDISKQHNEREVLA